MPDWFGPEFDYVESQLRQVVEESIWIGNKYRLDLAVASSSAAQFLEKYAKASESGLSQIAQTEAKLASTVLKCNVPRLNDLTISDIVNIRQQSSAFGSWRSHLRNVLNTYYADYECGTVDELEFARYAAEELSQGKMDVEKEIRESHYLSSLESAAIALGFGTLTAIVTAPYLLTAAVVAGVATGGSTFLIEYISSKARSKKKSELKALCAHFAIFDME